MDIVVTPFDASNEQAAQDALAVQAASVADDLPDFPGVCAASTSSPGSAIRGRRDRSEHAVAYLDGEAVGYLDLGLPQLENLENADVAINVVPTHRRRGVGGVLYRWAEELARANGRKKMLAMTVQTLPGGPERDDAGVRFVAARGFKPALGEVRRRLDVTALDQPALDRMLADGWAKADGYRLVRWIDLAPDELLDDVAYLDQPVAARRARWATSTGSRRRPTPTACARARPRSPPVAGRNTTAAPSHEETGRLVAWTTLDHRRHVEMALVPEHHDRRRRGTGGTASARSSRWKTCAGSSPSSRRSPRSTP